MRKERVQGEEEGGRGVRGAEMVVVLIRQRNTALRVLLKRPHKPELSLVGGRPGHTEQRCRSFPLGSAARALCTHRRQVWSGLTGPLVCRGGNRRNIISFRTKKNKWKLLGQSSFFREL